jgi:hypothetical protein
MAAHQHNNRKKMKKSAIIILAVGIVTLLGLTATSNADPVNITVYDGTEDSTHIGVNQGREDEETEPGMIVDQVWDLEGFFLDGSTLSMIGGFDFNNGVPGYANYTSGDIFIDIDGAYGSSASSFSPSNGFHTVSSNFGYEYVLDLNFSSMTYDVLKLDSDDATTTVWYELNQEDNPGSNPWKYNDGGTAIGSGSFMYTAGLSDLATGFSGGTHYSLSGFDLSFLAGYEYFNAHFTMGCGNDNLMGHANAPVPEPATMILFGTGIAGLAGSRLRRRKK